MRTRHALLIPAILAFALVRSAGADGPGPVVHEQIPPDPHEDLSLNATVDGEMPVAIDTKSGPVDAPDPRRAISPGDTPSPGGNENENTTFHPDRDTKRPNVQGYDEPFTPSTAPFKRLEAFDSVNDKYELFVSDKRLTTMPLTSQPAADGSDDLFFADMVVDVAPGKHTRIPSVGPATRIVHAHLSLGPQDVSFHVMKDGAENWFLEAYGGGTVRARLVMELTIPRGVFGGEFADRGWNELGRVPPLPLNVAQSAKEVLAALGLSTTSMRPREAVAKLVTYFRSFVDSEEPPRGRKDIYLDLALSKKGVCRHRAFAFMITAQSLGIPSRMVMNEAHAWVEAHDGAQWRRIDLGGAGRMVNPASNAMPERQVHQTPPDTFQWPQGSERGEDMVEQARKRARDELEKNSSQPDSATKDGGAANPSASASASSPGGDGGPASLSPDTSPTGPTPAPSPSGTGSPAPGPNDKNDERMPSSITVKVTQSNAHRGMPLNIEGEVKSDGDICPHVMVEIYLRDPKAPYKRLFIGASATNDKGVYTGAIVLPGTIPLGDYDVVGVTQGDTRCGRGASY